MKLIESIWLSTIDDVMSEFSIYTEVKNFNHIVYYKEEPIADEIHSSEPISFICFKQAYFINF